MKTVADIWNAYAKVLPSNAGSIQTRETKRAFLSGMLALDFAMNELGTLPEEQAVRELEQTKIDLMDELLKLIREDFPGGTH